MRNNRSLTFVLASLLLLVAGAAAQNQEPQVNISTAKHPNLAAAQQLSRQAWEKLVEAQKENNYDMNDHAQKAKDLLVEVNKELSIAAEVANSKEPKK